jgi:nucleotide-binding universal stress UspA family protein
MADANFKRVLIAVGAGDTSVQAARVGLNLAKALGAESAILNVVEPLTSPSSQIGIPAGELLQVVDQEEDTCPR